MISIQNLDFSYKKKPVFSGIDLQFAPGNVYGLLGENGVGKTTLLKLICGLLRPQNGTCSVDDLISHERQPEMLQDMFFLPDTVELPIGRTPRQYMESMRPFYPKLSVERFEETMQELEVNPNWRWNEMSYGQQKKSLIACALSMGTRYLLLDEPTNGLDIPSKSQFRSLLAQRVDEETTIILSTHQVKDVENLIDPIVILSQNQVLLNASLAEITEKLLFEYSGERNAAALYSEMQPGGWLNVTTNPTGEESQVNIEALFNAVHNNPRMIHELFVH